MDKLVLHPTDTSQWYALVNEAQAETRLILNESTESYLVFLLMRFSMASRLIDSILAMDFLNSMKCTGKHQLELLRDVGDKSLLFCGLFPGMAQRRRVSINYFVGIGQTAYLAVSELQDKPGSDLYFQLSDQFIDLQKILQAMRGDVFKKGWPADKSQITQEYPLQ